MMGIDSRRERSKKAFPISHTGLMILPFPHMPCCWEPSFILLKKKYIYIYFQINNPAFSKLLLQYQQRRFQIDMSLSQKTIL